MGHCSSDFLTMSDLHRLLHILVGYSFQRFTDESLSAGNSQFLIDGFLYNNLGAGAYPKPSVGSSASKDEMASFFGRVNYSFKDRYLLTAQLILTDNLIYHTGQYLLARLF